MESKQPFMLSDEQVEQLFKFCAKHYVHDYDVQCELVDHLAEGVEAKLTADPALSFEKALEQVYIGFGIKGFADVVRTKIKEVAKNGRRERRRLFLSYFTWPKAIILCVAGLLVYTIGQLFPVEKLDISFAILVVLAVLVEVVLSIIARRRFKKPAKKLLILPADYFLFPVISLQVFNFYFIVANGFEEKVIITLTGYYIFSAIFMLSLLLRLASYHFWKKTYMVAKERYPKAFA